MSGEILPAIGDFPAGSRIAGYQIEQLIGRGGMASVYRANDVRLDRVVALKVLAPQLAEDDAFRQRFIRESRSGAAVDHPNVIPVFEAGEADGVLFIAMRFVTGGDVRALLDREGRLTTGRTANIVTQVASALDAAHAHGLIHRDVKPANMLLATVATATTPDHVYLSDFGLSKLSLSQLGSLTGTGQFLGTLDYMSPEQIEGRPVDGRTDLYALACGAFEMLTGEPPFRREANLAVMWAQVAAPPPSVREHRPDLPPGLDRVLTKALAKSPDDRQSTCLEFAEELRAACAVRPAAGGLAGAQSLPPPTEAIGPIGAGPVGASPVGVGPGFAGGGAGLAGGGAVPAVPAVGGVVPGLEATVTEAAAGGGPIGGGGRPADGAGRHGGFGGGGGAGGQQAFYSGAGPGGFAGPPAGAAAGYPGGPAGPAGRNQFGAMTGPPSAPPGQTDELWQSPGGYQPAPGPPRRGGRLLGVLAGLLIVAVLAGAAVLVLHLRSNGGQAGPKTSNKTTTRHSSSSASSPSVTPSSGGASTSPGGAGILATAPKAVVRRYYRDVNNHAYLAAYNINEYIQPKQTFGSFKAGFDTTASVQVTIDGVSGDVVTVNLASTHTNGQVVYYSGSYTVQNGKIVYASIAPS